MPKVTRPGNVKNPRHWLAGLATQMILSWFARAHNYCVAPGKLDIDRVQSANDFRNARIVRLEVNLVREGRPQHAKTRLCNLTSLLGRAPVADWPKEHARYDGDEKQHNGTTQ